MTKKDLYWWYRFYNRRYFSDRLPQVRLVWYSDRRMGDLLGETVYKGTTPVEIRFNLKTKTWGRVTRLNLLHEMVHVALPFRVHHGPKFQAEMLRLAKAGAFNALW